MLQRTYITNRLDDLRSYLLSMKEEWDKGGYADAIMMMSIQEDSRENITAQCDLINEVLPGVKVMGVTMPEQGILPEYGASFKGGGYSALFTKSSRMLLYHYDCQKMTPKAAGKEFFKAISGLKNVACVMGLSAGIETGIDLFLNELRGARHFGYPFFGIQAGSGMGGNPVIFGDFGIENCGICGLVFIGEDLHVDFVYDMGWKPIGKEMPITETQGNYTIKSIAGKPAASVYERYLGVEQDDYFLENVQEFPFVVKRENREMIRTPFSYHPDGSLSFVARVNEGESVRLAYGNPRGMMEETRHFSEKLHSFYPEVLFLIICENRASFLGDLSANDINAYRSFAPEMAWMRGFAAMLMDSEGAGVLNSALIAFGLREGEANVHEESGGEHLFAVPSTEGAVPLDQRLSYFLEQTTMELEEMAHQAEAANVAKSEFLSNMSHEIRTPINAVLGMDEMILRESNQQEVVDYAKNIHAAGSSLLSIVNDILDFSKIEAGKMTIVEDGYELGQVVTDLINLVRLRAEKKGLELLLDLDTHLPHRLYGDEVRIKQVITNILTNAVKYTEAGNIQFCVSFEKADEEHIRLLVAVKDTGIGIKEEDLHKLFSAFDRLELERNKKIEGTGLGLNITRELLRMMGSELVVESVYGEGSTFSFSLLQKVLDWEEVGNLDRMMGSDSEDAEEVREQFVAPDARILVVDDAPMNLEVMQGLLRRTKIQVDTCDSGFSCLEKFATNHYDMVFLDHRMPKMDGMQTLERMWDEQGEKMLSTPVICLTANALTGARERYIRAGFTDYLAKPVMPEELEEMLLKYLPDDFISWEEVKKKRVSASASGTSEAGTAAEDREVLPSWLYEIETLDIKKGMSYCGGAEGYLDVLRIFANSVESRAAEIKAAWEGREIADLTVKVHALKSMARSVGAVGLSFVAQSIEDAGDAGDEASIAKHIDAFMEVYRELGESLSPLADGEAKNGATGGGAAGDADAGGTGMGEELPEISPEEFLDAMASIQELAVSYDHESIQMVLGMLREVKIPETYIEKYGAVTKAIDGLQWDELFSLLSELLGA